MQICRQRQALVFVEPACKIFFIFCNLYKRIKEYQTSQRGIISRARSSACQSFMMFPFIQPCFQLLMTFYHTTFWDYIFLCFGSAFDCWKSSVKSAQFQCRDRLRQKHPEMTIAFSFRRSVKIVFLTRFKQGLEICPWGNNCVRDSKKIHP